MHWNFISALLSDLFGIQARGGCLCAGPYGHSLLRISPAAAELIQGFLVDKNEILRPGYVRVSLNFSWDDATVDFVIAAVAFVAEHGWKLLPSYTFWMDTGEWRHRSVGNKAPHRTWLGAVTYSSGNMQYANRTDHFPSPAGLSYTDVLAAAVSAVDAAIGAVRNNKRKTVDQSKMFPSTVLDSGLQWFVLPSEVTVLLQKPVKYWDAPVKMAPLSTHDDGTVLLLPRFKGAFEINDLPKALPSTALTTTIATAPMTPPKAVTNRKSPVAEKPVAAIEQGDLHGRNYIPHTNHSTKSSSVKVSDEDRASGARGRLRVSDEDRTSGARGRLRVSDDDRTSGTRGRLRRSRPDSKLWPRVPKTLLAKTGKAVMDYSMIKEGDRVLLGLSGGKDSLALLHVLHAMQQRAPIRWELACVTMDPQFPGFNPSPLIPYLETLSVPRRKNATSYSAACIFCVRWFVGSESTNRLFSCVVQRRSIFFRVPGAAWPSFRCQPKVDLLVVLAYEARHPLQLCPA